MVALLSLPLKKICHWSVHKINYISNLYKHDNVSFQ